MTNDSLVHSNINRGVVMKLGRSAETEGKQNLSHSQTHLSYVKNNKGFLDLKKTPMK